MSSFKATLALMGIILAHILFIVVSSLSYSYSHAYKELGDPFFKVNFQVSQTGLAFSIFFALYFFILLDFAKDGQIFHHIFYFAPILTSLILLVCFNSKKRLENHLKTTDYKFVNLPDFQFKFQCCGLHDCFSNTSELYHCPSSFQCGCINSLREYLGGHFKQIYTDSLVILCIFFLSYILFYVFIYVDDIDSNIYDDLF